MVLADVQASIACYNIPIKLICSCSDTDADNSSDDNTLTTAAVDDDTLTMCNDDADNDVD